MKNKSGIIVFLIIALVIFITAYILLFNVYRSEGEKRSVYIENPPEKPDYIEVIANIVTIDPIRGDLTVRMIFEPKGRFKDEKGCLSEEVNLYINSSTGKQEYNFTKHKFMNPVDVTLNLFDGLVTDYPLDKHKAELIILTSEKRKIEGTQEIDEHGIENVLNFSGSVAGYQISAEQEQGSDNSYTFIDIKIERADSVKYFAFFVIAVMWLLILMLFTLVFTILFKQRKIEVNMFTFSSAMIFAFPAFRNMMPFAPAIGAFPDYIAFFWAEATAALTLATLILTWSIRKPA